MAAQSMHTCTTKVSKAIVKGWRWMAYPVFKSQTRTSLSHPPLTRVSPQGTIAQTPITCPCNVRCESPLVSKTWILALSSATMIYFSVRCRLVTTPPSWVMLRTVLMPPERQAASTRYRCLKCDLYVRRAGRAGEPSALRDWVIGLDVGRAPGKLLASSLSEMVVN